MASVLSRTLEHQPQAELNLPCRRRRAADKANPPDGPGAGVKYGRRREPEIGPVEQVENIGSEIQSCRLGERKALLQRKVKVRHSRTWQC